MDDGALVLVHYDGCQMEVLRQCRGRSKYSYTPITPKHDNVTIHDEDELYAHLPLGAARLEGTLKTDGQLNVDMTFVGTYESSDDRITRDGLDGDCDRATHVAYALTVGAFDFYSGASATVGAGAAVGAFGAGGSSESKRSSLDHDGSEGACSKSTRNDTDAPDGCAAPLRLELAPIGEAKQVATLPTIDLGEYPDDERLGPIAARSAPQDPRMGATYGVRFVFYSSGRNAIGRQRDAHRVGAPPWPDDDVVRPLVPASAGVAWTSLTTNRDQLVSALTAAAPKRAELAACRAAGCPKEDALRQAADANDRAASAARQQMQQAIDKLVQALEAGDPAKRTGGTWFAIGYAHEVRERARRNVFPGSRLGFEWDPQDPDTSAAADAYAHAATATSADEKLGWLARYQSGFAAMALHPDIADQRLADLANLPERPESVFIHEMIVRRDLGSRDYAGANDQARWMSSRSDPLVRDNGIFIALYTGCQQGTWSPTLFKSWVEARPTLEQETASARSGAVGLDRAPMGGCFYRAGGLDDGSAALLPDAEAGDVLTAAGVEALNFRDFSGATQALEASLQRSPQGPESARAVAWLTTLYERAGASKRAGELRDALVSNYGPTSAWAVAAKRAGTSAEVPSPMPLPPVPKTDEERKRDVTTRVEKLFEGCVDDQVIPSQPGYSMTRIELTATLPDARRPVVQVKFLDGDAAFRGAIGCLERQGPLYFRDASAGVHVIARISGLD